MKKILCCVCIILVMITTFSAFAATNKTVIDVVLDNEDFGVKGVVGDNTSYQMVLSGDAKYNDTNPGVQLVDASGNEIGGAFISQRLNSKADFAIGFKVYCGGCSSGSPADGFMFVLAQNTKELGEKGGGIGYSGIKDSICVEYDTYHNQWDPQGTIHCDFHTNGNADSTSKYAKYLWDNSTNYDVYCWIEYTASTDTLQVRFSKTTDRPADANMTITDVDVTSIIGQSYYMGFTAATGGCNQQIILKTIYYDGSSNTPIDFNKEYTGKIVSADDKETPQTGDSTHLMLYICLTMISAIGLAVIVLTKKRCRV